MWKCEDNFKQENGHFQLQSVAQKRCVLNLPNEMQTKPNQK